MSDERGNGAPFAWGLTPRVPEPADPVEPAAASGEVPDWDTPTEASPVVPDSDWDTPTEASPVVPDSVFPLPPSHAEVVTQAFPALGVSLDPALDGATELLGAHAVGLPVPEDEGLDESPLDDLFGESSFREYEAAPLIPPLQPRASSALVVSERATPTERVPLQRTQKILLGVAGGLVALLALLALFLIGLRVAQNSPPPAAEVSSPPPSAAPDAPLVGPVAAGEHQWDELLGGECLGSFESAWQDRYTVVDCSEPHPAQMVYTGVFADAADVVFPGTEELQKRVNLLCSAPTVIDYAATAGASDIQITASFAANDADWAAGNRTYYCFVNRSGGADFTTSIAVPPVQ